jgi:DNA-binding CsgD family transcriptional regulator
VSQMAFLKDKFDLTPAEVRLVLRLMEGDSLRSSAAALGIAYETARTVLKSVFHKTSTCRQAELIIVIINAMKGQDGVEANDPDDGRGRELRAQGASPQPQRAHAGGLSSFDPNGRLVLKRVDGIFPIHRRFTRRKVKHDGRESGRAGQPRLRSVAGHDPTAPR